MMPRQVLRNAMTDSFASRYSRAWNQHNAG